MKNIIRVHNLTTKKIRLYEIPMDTHFIHKGELVRVQFGDDATALGVAACDSTVVPDETYSAMREALGLDPNGSFKMVLSTYEEHLIPVPDTGDALPDEINEALDELYEDDNDDQEEAEG